jgi:hypothetical protein
MNGFLSNGVVDNHHSLYFLYTSHFLGAKEWFQVAFRLNGTYGINTDII